MCERATAAGGSLLVQVSEGGACASDLLHACWLPALCAPGGVGKAEQLVDECWGLGVEKV